MSVKSLLCLIGFLAVTIADDRCTYTDGYEYYPEVQMHYKFVPQALTWGKAREFCLSENATLAVPVDEKERDTIVKIFARYPVNVIKDAAYADYVLLGLHDFFEENEFINEGGFGLEYFYHDFDIGQPSGGRAENCLSMSRSGKYHDYPHGSLGAFICEKNTKDHLEIKHSYKDQGYVPNLATGKKYKLHSDPKTWGVARAICSSEGGKLAIIRNKQEEMFLADMLNNQEKYVKYSSVFGNAWIGVHDMFIEWQFDTVTGYGESLERIGYSQWKPGQPNGGTGENCVTLSTDGQIQDWPCWYTFVYICEI